MSSLGWLNLQDYLGANREQADELAQRLDDQQAGIDEQAREAAARGDIMSYGDFLAKQRTTQALRQDDAGRGSMLGGDSIDGLLAARGKGGQTYQPAQLATAEAVKRDFDARQKATSDYWKAQTERNTGLAKSAQDERDKQNASVEASKKAMEDRAGGPGYRGYSQAVEKSFKQSRGKQVRVISDEEWNKWTR